MSRKTASVFSRRKPIKHQRSAEENQQFPDVMGVQKKGRKEERAPKSRNGPKWIQRKDYVGFRGIEKGMVEKNPTEGSHNKDEKIRNVWRSSY